jgi:hypothetical protein
MSKHAGTFNITVTTPKSLPSNQVNWLFVQRMILYLNITFILNIFTSVHFYVGSRSITRAAAENSGLMEELEAVFGELQQPG